MNWAFLSLVVTSVSLMFLTLRSQLMIGKLAERLTDIEHEYVRTRDRGKDRDADFEARLKAVENRTPYR